MYDAPPSDDWGLVMAIGDDMSSMVAVCFELLLHILVGLLSIEECMKES